MSSLEHKLFYQRHLPHYRPRGATLFITFRLAGSLPGAVIRKLELQKQKLENAISQIAPPNDRNKAALDAQKKLFGFFDHELESISDGPKWLAEEAIANIVCDALHERDGKIFRLEAYCVMPNHVHLVCTPLEENGETYSISKIMQSLKGSTAYKANQILGRRGSFWQQESYDRVVRDNDEFLRIVNYVLSNPERAGLKPDWVYCRPEVF